MDSIAKIRFLIAAILSPMIVPLVIYTVFVFSFGSVIEKNESIQTNISSATWLSYGTALVFGTASYLLLRRLNWWSVWRYMLLGTVAGLASWIVFSFLSDTWFFNRTFLAYIISGLGMGALFWLGLLEKTQIRRMQELLTYIAFFPS